MNIQAPNITSLKLASQITFSRKTAKCIVSKASYLLVFLLKVDNIDDFNDRPCQTARLVKCKLNSTSVQRGRGAVLDATIFVSVSKEILHLTNFL